MSNFLLSLTLQFLLLLQINNQLVQGARVCSEANFGSAPGPFPLLQRNVLSPSPQQFNYLFIYFWLHQIFVAMHPSFLQFQQAGLLFEVNQLLIVLDFLVVEHRFQAQRLNTCGTWAYLLETCGILPDQGIKPVTPVLAGGLNHRTPRKVLPQVQLLLAPSLLSF